MVNAAEPVSVCKYNYYLLCYDVISTRMIEMKTKTCAKHYINKVNDVDVEASFTKNTVFK